jgi:hypothetical protein
MYNELSAAEVRYMYLTNTGVIEIHKGGFLILKLKGFA